LPAWRVGLRGHIAAGVEHRREAVLEKYVHV
jgi:hypothetical protein